MKNAWFGLLCCSAALPQAVLAPSPSTHLSGIVTDSHGTPLAGVALHHTGIEGRIIRTNAEGRFDVETRAPAIVFRKTGFQGRYFRVERDAPIEIRLEPALRIKACRTSSGCLSLRGFDALSSFCLPKIRGVGVTAQANDIDYGQRQFLVRTPRGAMGIQHAAGSMWGEGLPLDEDVWAAVEYRETDYLDAEGSGWIDARGRDANGDCWRVLGHPFETASYRMVASDQVGLLDQVLDGTCLRPRKRE